MTKNKKDPLLVAWEVDLINNINAYLNRKDFSVGRARKKEEGAEMSNQYQYRLQDTGEEHPRRIFVWEDHIAQQSPYRLLYRLVLKDTKGTRIIEKSSNFDSMGVRVWTALNTADLFETRRCLNALIRTLAEIL